MVYRVLADLVMIVHGAMLIFFVIGGFLAWRWPRVAWAHLTIAGWNLLIVLLDFNCPVTALEKELRRRGGEQPYGGGYIQHYVDGVVYPAGYTWLAEIIGFTLLVFSYSVLVVRMVSRRRADSRQTTEPR